MNFYSTVILYYCVSSFGGWLLEFAFRSIKAGRLINPGFLYGPFVPIYGYATVLVFITDTLFTWMPLWLKCILFCLIPSLLEYTGSAAVERLFSLKLWDYSDMRFNIKGRVCLLFSSIWAVLILVCYVFYQPFMTGLILSIPDDKALTLAVLFTVYLIADTALSMHAFSRISRLLKSIADIDIGGMTEKTFASAAKSLAFLARPLNAFPNLYNETASRVSSSLRKELLRLLKASSDCYNDVEFMDCIHEVITNPEFLRLKSIHHHYDSIYSHSLKVAYLSFRIGKLLEKAVPVHIKELARGAMLHDFFLYDWHERKFPKGKNHAFEHPKEALRNSLRCFPDLTPIEKDIIAKHMFPLCFHIPRYRETFIVIVTDKLIAGDEFLLEFLNGKSR